MLRSAQHERVDFFRSLLGLSDQDSRGEAAMKKVLVLLFAGTMLGSLGASNSRAQATWGAISGYVSDPTGAAIPSANITVTEVKTGIVTKGVTDSVGLYNITHLNPGEYKVEVEASGFKRFVQEHVTLQVDSTVRIDPKLELGEV